MIVKSAFLLQYIPQLMRMSYVVLFYLTFKKSASWQKRTYPGKGFLTSSKALYELGQAVDYVKENIRESANADGADNTVLLMDE